MKEKIFRPFTNKTVIIEQTDDVTVYGYITISVYNDIENYMSNTYNFTYLVGEISWLDPASNKKHYVRLREDFY